MDKELKKDWPEPFTFSRLLQGHVLTAGEWDAYNQCKVLLPLLLPCFHTEFQGGAGSPGRVKWRESLRELALARLPSLTMGFGMQLFPPFLLTFANNVCPHSNVTPESFWRTEARVKCTVGVQKRFANSVFCALPALHRRGSSLVAVVLGHFRDHSWVDRTLQPTIYEAFLPSPCSAATGESGCRWCLSFAGPCESLPATDYWEVPISGWTHLWWRNNYKGGKTLLSWM